MPYLRSQRIHTHHVRQRLLVFLLFCSLAWLILLGQLWWLQIGQQQKFADLSLNNRIRLKRITAPRGLITDRYNTILVSNRSAFHAALILEDAGKHLEESLSTLSRLLDIPKEQFKEKILQAKPELLPFRPLLLLRHLTPVQVALLEERQLDLPGITVIVEPVRNYHFGKMAAHFLGYVGEITEAQLKAPRYKGMRPGNLIGQAGIEKSFNAYLTGEDGGKQIEVNAEGRELQVLGQRQSMPGLNLDLTLDWQFQCKAEELMQDKTGALVALDPNNGEVLAMVSRPSFDPNLLAVGISRQGWREIIDDPNDPLQNRVIQSQYPPGSVFKTVLVAAGLEEGLVDLQTQQLCLGKFYLGKWGYDCWRRGGHGEMDLVQALVQSCNVFFYKLGNQLGVEKIAAYANKFGLGRPSGIDLSAEKGGLVPTPAWKKRFYGSSWLPGETISLSIGQGYLGVTPLQLANLMAVVANEGTLYRPRLVKRIISADGQVERVFHPEVLGKINLKASQWQILHQALRGVVNGKKGTGRQARIPGITVAGKTGTAQVVAKRPEQEDLEEKEVPEELRDHAWFVAFAPAGEKQKPLIALAILVEHGGHGGSACAPLARELIKEYFQLRFPHLLEEAKLRLQQARAKAAREAKLKATAQPLPAVAAPAQAIVE